MILKNSIDHFSLLKGKIDELFRAIMKTDVDSSPLKSQIQKYMESIDHFVAVQCANSTKISFEVKNERLIIIASQIANALNSETVEARHCELLKTDLVTLDAKQDALKKELEQLGIQRECLYNSILETDENLVNKQNDISRLRQEHVAIAQNPCAY